MPEFRLHKEIVALSEDDSWYKAKLEWILDHVYDDNEFQTCLCGHYPIKEICVLKNTLNRRNATVGNCCVKKFMENIDSDSLFKGAKKIKKDAGKSINEALLNYAKERGWINDWEHKFYKNIIGKRKLTLKQRTCKEKVNNKILSFWGKQGKENRGRNVF